MSTRHRFNIFGRIVDIERAGPHWKAFAVGNDGKRAPGGFVVPDDIEAEDLGQYLFDLFHEEARPGNGDVRRIAVAGTASDPAEMQLVWPGPEYLRSYCEALERGWSPNNLRSQAAKEELAAIRANPDRFLAEMVDFIGEGRVKLPDGTEVPRLPGYRKWMWDGEFCGSIQLRWTPGGETLPPYCLGHIGYAVVPWKRQRGYATRALGLVLQEARERGLQSVEITTQPDNLASRKVIAAQGGVLVEEFEKLPSLGGGPELRFRIACAH